LEELLFQKPVQGLLDKDFDQPGDHIVSKTIPPLRPRMKGQGHLAQIVHEFRQRFLGIDPVFPIKAIILRKKGHLFGS
jgi:hypothetical protein